MMTVWGIFLYCALGGIRMLFHIVQDADYYLDQYEKKNIKGWKIVAIYLIFWPFIRAKKTK